MLQSRACRIPHEQASSFVIWFVYAPGFLILAGAIVRLVPAFLGERTHRIIAAAIMILSAILVAYTPSSGWVLQARYHLLSDTPVYIQLALDGLSMVTSLALLLSAAWAALVPRDSDSALEFSDWGVLSATLFLLLAANPLTLAITWTAFALVRVVVSRRETGETSSLVIASELASLTMLLAAIYPLGMDALSTPLFPMQPQGIQSWLVIVSSLLRMGLFPLQANEPSHSNLRVASALTGLYLLLRTVQALPTLAIAAALLGLGSALMAALSAARIRDTKQSWGWLLQHVLFVGILAAALGSESSLAGLGVLVCIAWCARITMGDGKQPAGGWDLAGVAALGGIAPTLGWSTWTETFDALKGLGSPWIMMATGLGFAICAWTVGHNLRALMATQPMWWRDLLRWQDVWRGLPALLLVAAGIWSSMLTYHGRGPVWGAAGSHASLLDEAGIWPIALGIATLTGGSLALGWLRREGADKAPRVSHATSLQIALRSTAQALERVRKGIVLIDCTLREHAVLAWTALAAAALALWLHGR